MAMFSEEEIKGPGFIKKAVAALYGGAGQSDDGLLLPPSMTTGEKIVLCEWIRRHEDFDLAWEGALSRFDDFAEIVCNRRPDPTFDEWLWLYANLGHRHPNLSPEDACQLMAGRNALWPFLQTVPDHRIRQIVELHDEAMAKTKGTDPIPYPNLEEAIQSDSPGKVMLYRSICHADPPSVLARAMTLEKTNTVSDLLHGVSETEKARCLIRCMEHWQEPLPLLKSFAIKNADFMHLWRDSWGNSLFWYVYFREPIQRECAEFLFGLGIPVEEKNGYGISAMDLWKYYRPRVEFPPMDHK